MHAYYAERVYTVLYSIKYTSSNGRVLFDFKVHSAKDIIGIGASVGHFDGVLYIADSVCFIINFPLLIVWNSR